MFRWEMKLYSIGWLVALYYVFFCPVCNEYNEQKKYPAPSMIVETKTEAYYYKQVYEHQENQIACDKCRVVLRIKPKVEIEREEGWIKCPICGNDYKRGDWENHKKTHKKEERYVD